MTVSCKLKILLLLELCSGLLAGVTHLYVSPTGSDSNNGTSPTQPLKTIQKAVNKTESKNISGNEVYIELMEGYHDLHSTVVFPHGYSAPVTVRSYQHQQVHVTGGKRIPSSQFKPVIDPDIRKIIPQVALSKVVQVHLPDVGITDYGKLSNYGYYAQRIAPLEIFINGNPLRLAEWPNNNYINVKSIPDGANGKRFTHSSTRDDKWNQEKEPWVYGFWKWSWADMAIKVTAFNTTNHMISLSKKPRSGMNLGSLTENGTISGFGSQGGYFRVINMLSELDQPGEYYIDRQTGILYLWPNTPSGNLNTNDIIYASIINECFRMPQGYTNINFEDFTLEACRQYGFYGSQLSHAKFTNLEIKNIGSYGLMCESNCTSVTVSRCDIHHTDGGIFMKGGDRKKLISSGNVIEDNHIWRIGRATLVGSNFVTQEGVNIVVRNNYMHDGTYTCVRWEGNDHIMEYNYLLRCCYNSSDCGAFHATKDWTMRGNIIRYNYVEKTLRFWPGADVRGVMLDDQYSSVNIEHNVFIDNEIHANIGGGRDNIIRYNVMYNATKASIQVDGRGSSYRFNKTLTERLTAVPYTNPIWKSKYPKLSALDNITTRNLPEGNEIYGNIYHNEKGIPLVIGNMNKDQFFKQYFNKHAQAKSNFYAPEYKDFSLRCAAKEWANGLNFIQPVSFEQVGPRHPYGPQYLNKGKLPPKSKVPSSYSQKPCGGTVAPETDIPHESYLPDGYGPNNLVKNITKQGCWLLVNECPAHPNSTGTYRDSYGETHNQTGTDEAKCLARAAAIWRQCGSQKNKPVTAVYGPTGAMTMGGDGCFMATYGCPKHVSAYVGIIRDKYAENVMGGDTNEEACLARAGAQWRYCGSDRNKPITYIFRPTGATRTGGAGCWIKVTKCSDDPSVKTYFYDSWGATNLGTDDDANECYNRAGYYWRKCGSNKKFPVTAYYRPDAKQKTVPQLYGH